jgi:hypothetical protein
MEGVLGGLSGRVTLLSLALLGATCARHVAEELEQHSESCAGVTRSCVGGKERNKIHRDGIPSGFSSTNHCTACERGHTATETQTDGGLSVHKQSPHNSERIVMEEE